MDKRISKTYVSRMFVCDSTSLSFAKTHRTEQCEDLSVDEYSDRSASSGPSLVRQKIFFSEYPVARHTWKVSDCAIPGDYVSCINVINLAIMIVYSTYVYTNKASIHHHARDQFPSFINQSKYLVYPGKLENWKDSLNK